MLKFRIYGAILLRFLYAFMGWSSYVHHLAAYIVSIAMYRQENEAILTGVSQICERKGYSCLNKTYLGHKLLSYLNNI